MTDADGDSQMQSSSSASASDSEMFPTAHDAPSKSQRPLTNGPASARLASGDMSPPSSQSRPEGSGGRNSGAGEAGAMDLASSVADAEPNGSRKADEEPGWAWTNPKAREEYDRSVELVLDRNFNMKDFGELFDEETIAGLVEAARR